MSDPLFIDDDEASTPLAPDEREGLIPSYIALRHELNEAEQIGIANADRWVFARTRNVLDETFLRRLHQRMFGKVWRWAGQYRTTPRNIGIEAYRISVALHRLLDDVGYWIEHGTYPPDEIAARFHHQLVFIHPFPNGNGRWSRLAADLLAVQIGQRRFTWGIGYPDGKAARAAYVAALRAADQHDILPLLVFVRA